MADIVDDSQPINIDVWSCEQFTTESECTAHGCYWYNDACHPTSEPQGLADIADTNYPSPVQSGVPFDMTYTVINTGAADTLFGGLYENGAPMEGTFWRESFDAGQIKVKSIFFPNGITVPLDANIRVGHEE